MPRRASLFSMFHRRLLLLCGAGAVVFGGLTAQLLRLSVLEGAEHRAEAESQLRRTIYLPTWRGRILDRHGRVLAADVPSYDICVPYPVITGAWIDEQALREAKERTGGDWNEMDDEDRAVAIAAERPAFETLTGTLWRLIRTYGDFDDAALLERRDAIRSEVQRLAAHVHDAQRRAWQEKRSDGSLVGARAFRPEPIREQVIAHVLLPRVDDEVAFAFQRLALLREGLVEVRDSTERDRPHMVQTVVLPRAGLPGPMASDQPLRLTVEGVADHLLGTVRREVWKEDIDRRPFTKKDGRIDLGGYRDVDRVGSSGLEAAFEAHLRGTRGMIVEHRATGARRRVAPVPGGDLQLSIDIALQARVQAILSHEYGLTVVQPWHRNQVLSTGWPLNGAAVVMEIATGEILAAVSMPTLATAQHATELRRAIDGADVNRPFAGIYPPGSILKPLTLWAGVESGAHDLDAIVECRGHFHPNQADRLRCWIYRDDFAYATHGPLGAEEAIARSCNIYFYTVGDELGAPRLLSWLRRFGLGARPDVGLARAIVVDGEPAIAGESAGTVDDEARVAALPAVEQRNAALLHAIGQGSLTWTPVQAATTYALLARGGAPVQPVLVVNDPRPPRPRPDPVPMRATLHRTILEGLRRSVEERIGTGHHITFGEGAARSEAPILEVRGVTVSAKTGTAQAPAMMADLDGDGAHEKGEYVTGVDHAWFVGLVGPRGAAPLYVVAVVIEYGGSGGRVSGPVANEIIRALQDEGYLPGGAT